jgi:hypothetical protein
MFQVEFRKDTSENDPSYMNAADTGAKRGFTNCTAEFSASQFPELP